MKRVFCAIILIVSAINIFPQQDAMYTHYMDNTLGINPAYAGSRDALTATLLHRAQWVGFEGAPTTQTFTIHSPVYEEKVNLGLSVLNDKIGPTSNTSIYADYAFRFRVSEGSKLSLGLKAGINSINTDLNGLLLKRQNDQAFLGGSNSETKPNFGFGIYYSQDRFYAGLSVPNLIENKYDYNYSTDVESMSKEKRHYYFIAGAMYKLSNEWDFKPTTFFKVTKAVPVEADVTGSFIYNEKFLLGAMYRTGDAAGALLGINLTDQLYLGYSFDWSFVNSTARYNNGSHEIILRYDFVFHGKLRIHSPRYV